MITKPDSIGLLLWLNHLLLQHAFTWRSLIAGFLLLLFIAPPVLQHAHVLLEAHDTDHHHHRCADDTNPIHLHDPAALNWHQCWVCAFHYNFFVESDFDLKQLALQVEKEQPAMLHPALPAIDSRISFTIRGPPALIL